MTNQRYEGHFAEVAARHGLSMHPLNAENGQPCANSLTQAVYTPGPGWCVKLLDPGSIEADKFRAERAILTIVRNALPVPQLLGYGVTETAPQRVYHVYEWVEGRLWKEIVPQVSGSIRLPLMGEVGSLLGKLHNLPIPGKWEALDIPRGNYEKWRSRNLPILEDNLLFLVGVGELTDRQADCIRAVVARARPRLFQSETALVHGDFSGQNILVNDSPSSMKVCAIIDWGNVGIDPLEADYEMALLSVLLPVPDSEGNVKSYDRKHLQAICRAFEKGYKGERGIGIDWGVMKAHALLQWVKRCVKNYHTTLPVSRSLAASIRMATSLDF